MSGTWMEGVIRAYEAMSPERRAAFEAMVDEHFILGGDPSAKPPRGILRAHPGGQDAD